MSDNRSILTGKAVGMPLGRLLQGEALGEGRGSLLTGVYDVDHGFGGLPEKGLAVIAGRPMMGKSMFAQMLARNMALVFRTPVGYISSGCSETELAGKMMAGIEEVYPCRMEMDGENVPLMNVVHEMQPPLYIQSYRDIKANLEEYCKMMVEKRGVKVIFLDTVDDMMHPSRDFYAPGRKLKSLAMRLGICIVAVAQLGRAVELRGGSKKPIMSDLRLGLELDAEMLMLLYRPECYGIDMDERGSTKGKLEVDVIGKGRSVDVNVMCRFSEKHQMMYFQRDQYALLKTEWPAAVDPLKDEMALSADFYGFYSGVLEGNPYGELLKCLLV